MINATVEKYGERLAIAGVACDDCAALKAEIGRLQKAIAEALETGGTRWEEWGIRALMIRDILNVAGLEEGGE